MAEALPYCASEVRRWDYDRFLSVLFAPAATRERLFALYAFNHEIAKVRETVSEPMLGHIRLQWWREAIAGLYEGKIGKHPVVEALAPAIVAATASARAGFEALIDAREFDLAGRAPATLVELESYCAGTSSQLLSLAADMLGAKGEATRARLRHLGIAWALIGLIRAIPFHARARRQYIPAEVAAASGLNEEALFALRPSKELRGAVRALAAAAARHLDDARADRADRAARPLLLLTPLARAYLRLLRRRGYDVMARPIELSPAGKIARLWWAMRIGTS
ncbi:MAG TPA: squalene/phytoene synthase family protein [Alphaproteobacteria bacterium]|jgi:phytoene synthase